VSAGAGVAATSVGAALTAAVGDGDDVSMLDAGGVQPAIAIMPRPANRPTRLKLAGSIFNDLTDGLAKRNALH